jgi:hypothetical protein
VESQDYSNPEGTIILYPSIPMSIDRNALDAAIAILENKGNENAPNEQESSEESSREGED